MKVGFLGLLGILFIGLKLTGFIDWSWVWVLAPIWFSSAIVILALGLLFFAEYKGLGKVTIRKVKD